MFSHSGGEAGGHVPAVERERETSMVPPDAKPNHGMIWVEKRKRNEESRWCKEAGVGR